MLIEELENIPNPKITDLIELVDRIDKKSFGDLVDKING